MKFWTIFFVFFVILSGCSAKHSSSVDSDLSTAQGGSVQGKPLPPDELPYFDWDALDGISAVQSNSVKVHAGTKQYSDANLLVTLRGQAQSVTEHPIVQVRWWQFSGPPAVIANPNQLHTQVLLPEVARPVTAIFRFAAINSIGEVNSAQVPVVIQPLSAPIKITAAGVAEEDSQLTFLVSLDQPAQDILTFKYFTEDDTATKGEDYLSMSGVVTFYPGQPHQPISVRLLQDNTPEAGEVFYLRLQGEIDGQAVDLRRLGLIVDQQAHRNLLSSVPAAQPLGLAQNGLPGESGEPRLLLRWEEGGMLRLVVEDPCGNILTGTPGGSAEAPSLCQGTAPLVQTGTLSGDRFAYFDNMAWSTGAANGNYKVFLEHVAGQAVEYALDLYGLGSATRFSGIMANGERVDVTDLFWDDTANTGGNRVTGSVVNATNTAPIAGARIRVYQDETLLRDLSVQTNFDLPLPAGTYRMAVIAEDYVAWSRDIVVTAAEPLTVRVSLSPILDSETEVARVVLTWGQAPSDLDSHLLALGQFHVSYRNTDVGSARLDVDDTNGEGPETITILNWVSGLYRYYVRDFSAGSNPASTTLASSGAVVQLYLGDEETRVFQVPQGEGYLWHVFDLDPATGEITVVNTITNDEAALDSNVSTAE